MKSLAAFAAGFLFSAGLALGGMTVPQNVVGFLDFFGHWNPALAFVMAGAVGVYAALFPLVIKKGAPLWAPAFELPKPSKPDARLFVGSAAFGAGWGLAGFCPGPALVTLGTGAAQAAIFIMAMAAGIVLHHFASRSAASDGGPQACG